MKNRDKKYYTIRDYAKLTGVSRPTIYRMIKDNRLKKDKDYIEISDGSIAIIQKQ
jgi:predicted DNA-binding transcriptional regulator AlpA